jgi:hypothetical protein
LKCTIPEVVSQKQAQLDIAFACTTVLSRGLDLLCSDLMLPDNLVRIASGIYRLLPYALEYWIEHCLLFAMQAVPLGTDHILSRQLSYLDDKHGHVVQRLKHAEDVGPVPFDSSKSPSDDRLRLIEHLPTYDLMSKVLHVRWLADQHVCENGEGKLHFRSVITCTAALY